MFRVSIRAGLNIPLTRQEGNSGIYEIRRILVHDPMFKFKLYSTFK